MSREAERMWWQNRIKAPAERAIAYYRHSAQDRQEYSIPLQQEQVRKYAEEHNIEIVKEFADPGKSGLTATGRHGFNSMLEYVRLENSFERVLVLDVGRWGRFQDIDLSARYCVECKKYGERVVYTNLGIEDDGGPTYALW